jgi:hypothetical protein
MTQTFIGVYRRLLIFLVERSFAEIRGLAHGFARQLREIESTQRGEAAVNGFSQIHGSASLVRERQSQDLASLLLHRSAMLCGVQAQPLFGRVL